MSLFKYASFAYAGYLLNKYAGNIPNTKDAAIATGALVVGIFEHFDNEAQIINKGKGTYQIKSNASDLELKISNHKLDYTSKNQQFKGSHSVTIPKTFSLYLHLLLYANSKKRKSS